jgi:hypothetical protein
MSPGNISLSGTVRYSKVPSPAGTCRCMQLHWYGIHWSCGHIRGGHGQFTRCQTVLCWQGARVLVNVMPPSLRQQDVSVPISRVKLFAAAAVWTLFRGLMQVPHGSMQSCLNVPIFLTPTQQSVSRYSHLQGSEGLCDCNAMVSAGGGGSLYFMPKGCVVARCKPCSGCCVEFVWGFDYGRSTGLTDTVNVME